MIEKPKYDVNDLERIVRKIYHAEISQILAIVKRERSMYSSSEYSQILMFLSQRLLQIRKEKSILNQMY
jgi:hypothetical protein